MVQKSIHSLPVTGSIFIPRGIKRAPTMWLEGVLPVTGFFCYHTMKAKPYLQKCTICGKEFYQRWDKQGCSTLCSSKVLSNSKYNKPPLSRPRLHIIYADYADLHLGGKHYTKVDLDDFYKYKDFRWQCVGALNGKQYAMRTTMVQGKNTRIRLYREIMDCPSGFVVDHINHDTLDNRKQNLRVVTQTQNLYNAKKNNWEKIQL
jgi:hypothetical protein